MRAITKDLRLGVALIVAMMAGMLFVPRVFFYGIVGFLAVAFSLGSLHYLVAVFRSPEMSWGRAGSCPMSRLSRLSIAALLGTGAAFIFIRGIVGKQPDTHYLLHAIMGLLVLVFAMRWWDARHQ